MHSLVIDVHGVVVGYEIQDAIRTNSFATQVGEPQVTVTLGFHTKSHYQPVVVRLSQITIYFQRKDVFIDSDDGLAQDSRLIAAAWQFTASGRLVRCSERCVLCVQE